MKVRLPIFNLGARIYDWFTSQDLWREQIARMLDAVGVVGDEPVRILDVGCGNGVSAFALSDALGEGSRVVGVDLAPAMIRIARRHLRERPDLRDRIRFRVADACDLPFEASRFDLCTGHSFLYLVPDRDGVLGEVRRVLKPGGRAVFMEPNQDGSLLGAAARGSKRWNRLVEHPLDGARFACSMVLWRLASRVAGRLDPDHARRLLERNGFERVVVEPTLGGLGLHCTGRVPSDSAGEV